MFSPVSHELVNFISYFLMHVKYTQKQKKIFTHFPCHKTRKTSRVMGHTRVFCENTRFQSKPISYAILTPSFSNESSYPVRFGLYHDYVNPLGIAIGR